MPWAPEVAAHVGVVAVLEVGSEGLLVLPELVDPDAALVEGVGSPGVVAAAALGIPEGAVE